MNLPELPDQPLVDLFEDLRKIPNNDWHARPPLSDECVLEIANKHEVFGFGLYAFVRAVAEEAVRMEREECAKAIEALRDDHCAGTKTSPDKSDWCEHDDQCCEFVVAWNEAASLIRSRTAVPAKE